jgi:hypothetical protein
LVQDQQLTHFKDKLPAPPSEAAKLSPREAAKLPALAAKDPPTDADSRRTFTMVVLELVASLES